MGLRFSHGDAQWSYHGFGNFRKRLANEIGIDLMRMDGFMDNGIPWDKIIDPIVPLLNHSDCEGYLSAEECASVAPRLRELVSAWDEDHDKNRALDLANGMDEAAREKESLLFK